MEVIDLLGAGERGVVGGNRHLLIVDDRVDGVDHVVGGERIAILEHHALTQREFERGRVDLLPRRGQGRLHLHGRGIAIDEAVEGLERHHHAGALRIVVGIDVRNGVAPGDAQRIGRLLRQGRSPECHAGGQ
jgi:hypothetical protein